MLDSIGFAKLVSTARASELRFVLTAATSFAALLLTSDFGAGTYAGNSSAGAGALAVCCVTVVVGCVVGVVDVVDWGALEFSATASLPAGPVVVVTAGAALLAAAGSLVCATALFVAAGVLLAKTPGEEGA